MRIELKDVLFSLMAGVFVVSFSVAQAQETKAAVHLDGMLGATIGDGFVTLNIGGPSFSLVLNEDFKVGAGLLPSIYIEDGKASTRLGLGPRIDLKKVSIIAPFFPVQSTGNWVGSLGLAYKFGRKK
jgi:hypothetical protein